MGVVADTGVQNSGPAIDATLRAEGRRCRRLILWLDCDREGEAIGFEVLERVRSANANLRDSDVYRARFSALIPRYVPALELLDDSCGDFPCCMCCCCGSLVCGDGDICVYWQGNPPRSAEPGAAQPAAAGQRDGAD